MVGLEAVHTGHACEPCSSSPVPAPSRKAPSICYCLLYLLIGSLSGIPNSPGESRSPLVAAPVAPGEVMETADGMCKFPGQQLSWWQTQEFYEVPASPLPDPIRVAQRKAPLQRPPRRLCVHVQWGHSAPTPLRSPPPPPPRALTVCVHVQWDPSAHPAELFSLAGARVANGLQLRAFAEPGSALYAAPVVCGHHAPFLAAFRADGDWHHVCATWEQRGGRWALLVDGRRRAGARELGAGQPVPPGGVLVLGQDQDSLGGGFSERDAFSGHLTDFHLWARALSPAQLHLARACPPTQTWAPGTSRPHFCGYSFSVPMACPAPWLPDSVPPLGSTPRPLARTLPSDLGTQTTPCQPATGNSGDVLRGARLVVTGTSEEPGYSLNTSPTLAVPSEECPTWDPGPCILGPALPAATKQTYQRLQDSQSWPGQDVISRVNALANAINLLPDPLYEPHRNLSLAKASSSLGILESPRKGGNPLGPAGCWHFLKRETALGAGEPEPLTGPWEELGRGCLWPAGGVSVASLVLEEQLAGAWLSVREVVGRPMALVASVLSTMLTSKWPQVHIQHRHAGPATQPHLTPGLEVRSLRLREASEGSVFTMPSGHLERPGHMHIPAREVGGFSGKPGLSGVTVIHGWFSLSVLQHTLRGPSLAPQAPDSSEQARRVQRFPSTQVGSAIISEVWHETEVTTAVTFHLQHHAQAFPQKLVEPICAFWNFSISPDTGGSCTTGCSVAALQESTACSCNRSTSFAVLLQVHDIQRGPEQESLLRTLSFVGGGGVFCALAATFLLFLVAGAPKSERATVHKNLTFSLAMRPGPYIFLAYNGEVHGAPQKMTEKAAEVFMVCTGTGSRGEGSAVARSRRYNLSFQVHTSARGQASHPRPSGPRDVTPNNPIALTPPRKHLALRGTHGPRIPTTFSFVEPERPAVELTAFKASVWSPGLTPNQSPRPDTSGSERPSKPSEEQVLSSKASVSPLDS
ncbi:LOW QUALITY PROTEIN: adhesion G protein-coupled receptor D2 [Molossus nigricans]